MTAPATPTPLDTLISGICSCGLCRDEAAIAVTRALVEAALAMVDAWRSQRWDQISGEPDALETAADAFRAWRSDAGGERDGD